MIKKAIFALLIFLLANTANALTASWSANNVSENVTLYTLYYKQEGMTAEQQLNTTTNGISVNDSSFVEGLTYVFSVSATNEYGEGLRSEAVKYTIVDDDPTDDDFVPDAPSGIKITIEKPIVE